MGAGYEQEVVWRAQELYCVDRLSYKKVSEITGVSLKTLSVWSQKYKWSEKREELSYIESEIRVDILRSRKKVLDMLLESDSGKECSQMAYAVNALENLVIKQQKAKILVAQNEQLYGKAFNYGALNMGVADMASGDMVGLACGTSGNNSGNNSGNTSDKTSALALTDKANADHKQTTILPINLGNKEEVLEKLGAAIQYRIACALQNPQAINAKTLDDIVKMLQCFGGLKAGVLHEDTKPRQTNVVIQAE